MVDTRSAPRELTAGNSRTDLRVAFCGPIASPGRPAAGGYEAANRRTIDLLRSSGVVVQECPYAAAKGPALQKMAMHAAAFVRNAVTLVATRNAWDVAHLTPLLRHFIWPEAMIVLILRVLGKPCLLDIRTGSMMRNYHAKGGAYRACLDGMISSVSVVGFEGEEYREFIEARRSGYSLFIPNFVSASELSQAAPVAPPAAGETVRLLILGRVAESKRVEVAVECLRDLLKRGVPATLSVAGTGPAGYLAKLKEAAAGLPVEWLGAVAHDRVKAVMAQHHLFLFPTAHPGEGHSNALTEAMAQGLVPICSPQGFNASVVGKAGRILPADATGADYARVIQDILVSGRFAGLSAAARQRVRENFTDAKVMPPLLAAYAEARSHPSVMFGPAGLRA